jgi:hypothetical protein
MRCRNVKLVLWLLLALPEALPSPAPPRRFIVTTQEQIALTAVSKGVPVEIALAVAQKESSFNQAARGEAGEIGIYQLMPGTASDLGVDPADQAQNIEGGIDYLRQLYNQFGSWLKALAAYNGGPGRMARGTTPDVSWRYAEDVIARSGSFGGTVDIEAPEANYDLASAVPDLSGVPNWAWLAAVGVAALMVVVGRD